MSKTGQKLWKKHNFPLTFSLTDGIIIVNKQQKEVSG